MTISSSLNAGVAGLQSNATRLATISDNIANSSTYGYKRMQTDFHSLVISSNEATYSAGGVRATTSRLIDENGSLVSTSNATDLAVRGRGFLPVAPASQVKVDSGDYQMQLTTTGSFRTDSDGFLRSDSDLILLGWPALPDGTIPTFPGDTSDGLEPVRINLNQISGEPTTAMSLGINLPATGTKAGASGEVQNLTVEYFNNLGNSENIFVSFVPTVPATGTSNTWNIQLSDSALDGAVVGEYVLTFDDSRGTAGALATVTDVSGGAYDPATGNVVINTEGGPMELNIGTLGNSDGITQLSDNFAPVAITKDGSPVGSITNIDVNANGFVTAFFDTGINRTIYQIPLVDIPNPNGMVALDQQTYLPSPESGSFFLWDAGDGPTGDIMSYAREESTVDVAGELTAMIQTQRAYSSNAKVIQTVDEMLQETTNIKR